MTGREEEKERIGVTPGFESFSSEQVSIEPMGTIEALSVHAIDMPHKPRKIPIGSL